MIKHLVIAASIFTLTACASVNSAVSVAKADIAVVAQKAQGICEKVSPLITLSDVATLLYPGIRPANGMVDNIIGTATSVRDKCVVIATATQNLAKNASVSSVAIGLLTNDQAIQDLEKDVNTIKTSLKI